MAYGAVEAPRGAAHRPLLRMLGFFGLSVAGVLSMFLVEGRLKAPAAAAAFALDAEVDLTMDASAESRPPNIVLITLDDVGLNDLGFMSTDLKGVTPRMDAMASQGIRLTNYYGQSLCTPARTALMSGKFGHRTGLLPAHLKDAGYATYGVGKWNVGFCNDAYLPTSRGFDRFLGYHSSGVDYYAWTVPALWIGAYSQDMGGVAAVDMLNMTAAGDGASTYEAATPPETRDGLPNYYTDLLFRDEALRARAEHRRTQPDTPLFLWYAPHGPHSDKASWPPRELVDDDTWSLLGDLKKSLSRERLGFALALSATDGSIGAIVDALSADGPLFVAVSSDNGADPCAAQFSGSNYPCMGGKKTFYEGGVHLPAFVWANDASGLMAAPGARTAALQGVRGSSFAGLMHHVDWVATLSSVAGRADHDFIDADYDSVDQYAALLSERADRYRPLYLTLRANPTVVVDDGYKVLYRARKSAAVAPDGVDADSCDAFHNVAEIEKQYFNLKRDPYEENNTFTDSPALHEVVLQTAAEVYADEANHPSPPFSPPLMDYVHGDIEVAFEAYGNTLVPWGCEAYH
ncbi:sulfuric ester hydrolase [Aureococcus anophagefferens]|nr:sulfuric ester hydrolase [Aureococcus anophagefferens]